MWQYTELFVNLLSDDFRNAAVLLSEAQEGVSGQEETWRLCVAATNAAMGPALGAMFVRKAFGDQSKKDVSNEHAYRNVLIIVSDLVRVQSK